MTTLEAHELFSRRDPTTGRAAFPHEARLEGGTDCWPATAAAACSLAGGLESAQDDHDLDELLGHYESLVNIGVRDDDELEAEAYGVLEELMEWGERHADEVGRELAAAGTPAG